MDIKRIYVKIANCKNGILCKPMLEWKHVEQLIIPHLYKSLQCIFVNATQLKLYNLKKLKHVKERVPLFQDIFAPL